MFIIIYSNVDEKGQKTVFCDGVGIWHSIIIFSAMESEQLQRCGL